MAHGLRSGIPVVRVENGRFSLDIERMGRSMERSMELAMNGTPVVLRERMVLVRLRSNVRPARTFDRTFDGGRGVLLARHGTIKEMGPPHRLDMCLDMCAWAQSSVQW